MFLAIAVVIAAAAVIVLAGGDDGGGESADEPPVTATATPSASATDEPSATVPTEETATPEPTPEPPPLLRSGRVRRIEVEKGETVRFRATSANADHVHVHGYDRLKDIPAGKTVTVSFKADIEGIFEIELEDAGEQIGELRVVPG